MIEIMLKKYLSVKVFKIEFLILLNMFLTDFVYFKFIISIKSYHKMKIFKKKEKKT